MSGQIVIITGGTSGIGYEACLALAREGAAWPLWAGMAPACLPQWPKWSS